jgi:hypothetical protein
MIGLPATGRRGFGLSSVSGQSLRAYPPARMIVFKAEPATSRILGG